MGSFAVTVGDRFRSKESRDRVVEVVAVVGGRWKVRNLEHRWPWNLGRETLVSGAGLARRWTRERRAAV